MEEKVLGIIAEYNPFHNGHLYHLNEAKKITNSKYSVAIISGNFTQRGDTSIINKWAKTKMALDNGIDLVIELPTIYSISSAENFARGAIRILNNTNIIDNLAFGTEESNIEKLMKIVKILVEEPIKYKEILVKELQKGISFPMARENAVLEFLKIEEKINLDDYKNILNNSNNILAIEYLKQLEIEKSNIKPIAIKREKVQYNQNDIMDQYASATAIRKILKNDKDSLEKIKKVVPEKTFNILEEEYEKDRLILGLEEYEKEIIYSIRKMTLEKLRNIPDVSEGLENLIKDASFKTNKIEELIEFVKNKRFTRTRIQRILLYILLDIDKDQMNKSKELNPYIRILGFNENGRKLISKMKKINSNIKIIISVNRFLKDENNLNETNKDILKNLNKDILATNIYTLAYKKESWANLDFTNNIITI